MEGTRRLIYFSSLIIGIISEDMTMTVEEGFPVTLPCLSADKHDDYDERSWYDGRFDDDAQPKEILFRQNEDDDMVIEKGKYRGMSINKENFSLDIRRAKLTDNGTYTCHVKPKKRGSETLDYLHLKLYILPIITMSDPKENRVYIEGDQLKANCTIVRIYPEIKETDFIMKWGGSSKEAAVRKNGDKSYRCLVDIKKTLSMEDHGKEVICKVTTKIGPTVPEVRRTLNVEYGAQGIPEHRVSESEPIPGETVTFTCNKGNTTANPDIDQVKWTKDGEEMCITDGPTSKPVMNINVTGEVNEGDYVTFTCDTSGIDSNPELTIVKWTKDRQDIEWPDISFSQIIKVTATDHGKYGCMVGNVIKSTPTFSDLSGLVELNVNGKGGGPGKAALVGGVVGGLAVIALVVVIVVVFLRKRQNDKNDGNRASDKADGLPHDYADIGDPQGDKVDGQPHDYDEIRDLPAISISSLHSTKGYVNAPMDKEGYAVPVNSYSGDHISTPNAVLNMDGANVERDLKDDYLEIIEPTAQAQETTTSSSDEHIYENYAVRQFKCLSSRTVTNGTPTHQKISCEEPLLM